VKKLIILMLLAVSANAWTPHAWAQARPQKSAVRDACAPIGKTADGQLVYGMACNAMPAPPPRTEAAPAAATSAEPEVERSGIFGMSYTRKPPSQ
jgi:hypothetical protein